VGSARSLYRLNIALAAVATLALALGAAAALRAISFDGRTAGVIASACRQFLLPDASAAAVAVLALASLSVAVLALGAHSLARQLLALRRFGARARPVDELVIDTTRVRLVDDPEPKAFCAGYLRPRVYLSTGALERLDADELRAVLAHERHHQRRRDPLRILIVHVLSDALFFVPVLRRLRRRYAALAELAADEAAVRAAGDRAPLASALLAFGETSNPAVVVGIAPERVDHLLGEPPRWELPISLLLGGLVTIAALGAVALGTASATAPGTLSLATLVTQACMLAMTAAPIILGAWLLLVCTRRLRGLRT
jgi:Zn-dependent protease with chaperone function